MLDLAGSAPSHQVKALVNGSIEMLMYSDHGRRYGAPSVTQQDNVLFMQIIFQYRDKYFWSFQPTLLHATYLEVFLAE